MNNTAKSLNVCKGAKIYLREKFCVFAEPLRFSGVKEHLIPLALIAIVFFAFISNAEALSIRHHLINATKNLVKMSVAPLKGIFITGPKNIKEAYNYEAYNTEKPEEKSKLRGIWRAPGEEMKGVLDGIVETVDCGRKFLWEIISIPWGD